MKPTGLPLFVKRDLDGFFGLFIDNLVQLLLIVTLCGALCGMTGDAARLIYARILPGAAISIVIGNLFYAWQAHRLAAREGRDDVCALPYGINTPSLLVYVFFVIAPEFRATGDAERAWRLGLLACIGGGVIELGGAFCAGWVRRNTPRAALLSTLAGIAIGFISMTFALQIWAKPVLAMVPLAIILITYFSRVRLPLGLPGGLLAVIVGTLIAWLLPAAWTDKTMSLVAVRDAWAARGWHLPAFCGGDLLAALREQGRALAGYLTVIIPMGLFNLIGSMQNIESAEAGGDRYATGPSMAVNGIGTIAAAFFGSCFPTTIYIGHPGWKRMGARAGYSTLNGIVIVLLVLSGTVSLVANVIPIEAGIAIVLWIGVVITAQAFQATPSEHAPAVAVGLFPAIAAWGQTVALGAFLAAGGLTMEACLRANSKAELSGFLLHGLLVMERGYVFTCMALAAISAHLIDRRFGAASLWAVLCAALTWLGLMHTYTLRGNNLDFLFAFSGGETGDGLHYNARAIVFGYLGMAALFALFAWRHRGAAVDDPLFDGGH
jgi:AGZA family xanthine/uracil permease-like MFS transporter